MSLEHGLPGIASLTFAAILGDAAARPRVDPGSRFIEVSDDWFGLDAAPGDTLPAGFSDPREICHYALTSGSTGARKSFGCTIEYVGAARAAGHHIQLHARSLHAGFVIGLGLLDRMRHFGNRKDPVFCDNAVPGGSHDRAVLDRLLHGVA